MKKWQSSSESEGPEDSSVGSLANRSGKIHLAAKQARDIEKAKKRAAKRARSELKNLAKTGIVKEDVHRKVLANLSIILKAKQADEAKIAAGEEVIPKPPLTREERDQKEKERKRLRKIEKKRRKKEKKAEKKKKEEEFGASSDTSKEEAIRIEAMKTAILKE